MPRVTRSPQAVNDISDLLTSLARSSRPAAVRLRAAIELTAKRLARSPRLGRERPDVGPDYRSYPVANTYIVYYRIISNGVELARVLHGARDVDPSMFDD